MPRLVRTLKRLIWERFLGRLARKALFSVSLREQVCRQEFFYNAFKALTFNGIDGDYVEFGCHGGMTFALAYHEARRHEHKGSFWAFDSFQGFPATQEAKDEHPAWVEGQMASSLQEFHAICMSNKIPREAYKVSSGFYDQTLGAASAEHAPNDIALAYIDCDLYSSTKRVLEFLMPRMKHGMIIAFDDYFCWSGSQVSGERKAMLEMFSKETRWGLLPYMQFGWHGQAYVVEDKMIANS